MVCPDLRGYGRSTKPPTTDDHSPYSKRAMAGDVVSLMRILGPQQFAVVGHDRGGPIDSGHHMAEDAPRELAAHLIAFLA